MRTIHKYPFEITTTRVVIVFMPRNAEVILIEDLPGVGPCMWAKVDSDLPKIPFHFRITNTGEKQPDGAWHIKSFLHKGLALHVWGVLLPVTPADDYHYKHLQQKDKAQFSAADREMWDRLSNLDDAKLEVTT